MKTIALKYVLAFRQYWFIFSLWKFINPCIQIGINSLVLSTIYDCAVKNNFQTTRTCAIHTKTHVHMTSLPLVHWETWVGLKLFNFPNKNKLNLFQLYIFFQVTTVSLKQVISFSALSHHQPLLQDDTWRHL